MGWGCYKHEWDAGSAQWRDHATDLCDRKLLKDEPRTFGRDGEVCPACYEELEASHAALAARVEALEGLQHALWHALDDCEERADEVAITMDHFLVLSARLPEDHPRAYSPRRRRAGGGVLKILCWIGLHSWTIYHRTAFNDETPRRVEKAFECSCCGKMKPTDKDIFV